jgi:hypothetical protein
MAPLNSVYHRDHIPKDMESHSFFLFLDICIERGGGAAAVTVVVAGGGGKIYRKVHFFKYIACCIERGRGG